MPVEKQDEFAQEIEKSVAANALPKKSSKLKKIFFALFLLLGAITGLHMGGLIDVRPFVWALIPKIPVVGADLQKYLNIPETYTITAEERRRLELEQWQQRLDAREREASEKLSQAEALSSDLASRTQKIEKQEAAARDATEANKDKSSATDEEKALMNELMKTYQEISPRRAALIVARLRNELAVDLLRKLPQDARASILSKMDPKRAAAITESLANPQQ